MEFWLPAAALLALGLVVNSAILWRLWNHYNRLTGKIQKKELLEALNRLMTASEKNQAETKELERKFLEHKDWTLKNLRKIGFKRFNPFSDTGGNQSFSFVLLDAHNDGIMISSLHSRENTRLYSKVITHGRALDQNLSREEQDVLNQALKQ